MCYNEKMKEDNIDILKSIDGIVDVKSIILDQELKDKIGSDYVLEAEKNSKLINVYRMVYLSQGHRVVGYIVEPKEGENLPCVIYNRGGSGDFGSIKIGHLFLRLSLFAKAGYITIFSQYSGNAGGEGVDEMGGTDIEDVLNLYPILKKYSRADASRIGMYGASRGGMMTYLALARTDWIKAAVIVAGTTDLLTKKEFRPEMEDHYIKMFGGNEEELKKRSVLYWADKLPKNVPILLMHGTADWRVNPLDSIRMAEELYKNKVPYRLVIFEGGDHYLSEQKQQSSEMSIDWMNRFVKNCESLPNLEFHGK